MSGAALGALFAVLAQLFQNQIGLPDGFLGRLEVRPSVFVFNILTSKDEMIGAVSNDFRFGF